MENERHIGDKITTERRYFIASIEADAKLFTRAVRTLNETIRLSGTQCK